jgi:nucleotide-binding universal stress UspA family protein
MSCLAGDGPQSDPRPVARLLRRRRIMVLIEFTPASEVACQMGIGLARKTGSLLELVCVLDAFTELFQHQNAGLALHPEDWLAVLGAALAVRAAPGLEAGVPTLTTTLVGAPALELVRHARSTGAAVVIVGINNATSTHSTRAMSVRTLRFLMRNLGGRTVVAPVWMAPRRKTA